MDTAHRVLKPGSSSFSLLVLGAGRSGTSLLAAMLDQHPGIEMGLELFANDTLRGKGLPITEFNLVARWIEHAAVIANRPRLLPRFPQQAAVR